MGKNAQQTALLATAGKSVAAAQNGPSSARERLDAAKAKKGKQQQQESDSEDDDGDDISDGDDEGSEDEPLPGEGS